MPDSSSANVGGLLRVKMGRGGYGGGHANGE